jgi:hypothetical protein
LEIRLNGNNVFDAQLDDVTAEDAMDAEEGDVRKDILVESYLEKEIPCFY